MLSTILVLLNVMVENSCTRCWPPQNITSGREKNIAPEDWKRVFSKISGLIGWRVLNEIITVLRFDGLH